MNGSDGLADEDRAALAAFRLRLGDRRFRGRTGGRRGHGAGSSLEFLDFRDYVPGDDLRHVDWRGYARSEVLRVRLHEEEVAPFVDLVVDPSASMAVTAAKARASRALAVAFAHWSQQEGCAARVLQLGGGVVQPAELAFADGTPQDAPVAPLVPLRRAGARILLTDGLWPGDPAPLLHTLQGGASRFLCVQLLDAWELAPAVGGALQLVDCEGDRRLELRLDARTVAGYRQRLQRLCERLRTLVVGAGGSYVLVEAAPLAAMASGPLAAALVVEPA
ncbi:MAG: DUF58 domain-containing protein [Planctomycetota bacterium]